MASIENVVSNILQDIHILQNEIQELNSFVYQLYGLSEDEIKIVEG
jgi:hypothetical protein